MIRDELCVQQQEWSWQSQCDGNLNIQESKNSGLKWRMCLGPLGYTVVACSEFVADGVKFKPLFS